MFFFGHVYLVPFLVPFLYVHTLVYIWEDFPQIFYGINLVIHTSFNIHVLLHVIVPQEITKNLIFLPPCFLSSLSSFFLSYSSSSSSSISFFSSTSFPLCTRSVCVPTLPLLIDLSHPFNIIFLLFEFCISHIYVWFFSSTCFLNFSFVYVLISKLHLIVYTCIMFFNILIQI